VHEYDLQIDPPAAYLSLQLIHPENGRIVTFRAKIDTGASMSVLPRTAVVDLGLTPSGDIFVSGFDRQVTQLPLYTVTFQIEGYIFPSREVTVSPRQDVLLGRDLLNHFILTLDGKNRTFNLIDP